MSLNWCIVLAVFLPLLGSPILPILGRRLGPKVGWVALAFPVLSSAALIFACTQLEPGARLTAGFPWIPSLGLRFSFLLDGFSLFFALVVSVMGVLIFFYANFYLDHHYHHHGRFYCYLTLFMAAMLGTVLSNHLLLLFVFWELTGLASFLLIGFLHEESPSRVGARQALIITGSTGLLMLVGIILLGQATGNYELSILLPSSLPWSEHGSTLRAAMVLILLGAFGKSAQIPFHFWLPNAMAAPTPVSAYLHSATMVKLGVFLTGRVFPLFAGQALWHELLIPIGFATMLLGAVFALLSNDLKAILAYSTVSALGSFIGYYGLGGSAGVTHDLLHISNHVLYKGCLFMVAGIVTHATGLRDIRQLGGLGRRLPLLGLTALLACVSMAGLPPTIGFISKEAILTETFAAFREQGTLGAFAAAALFLASVCKVAFSVRFFYGVFMGPEPAGVRGHYHAPSRPMLWPPLLLAAGSLLLGLAPTLLEKVTHLLATPGLNPAPAHLALWHGFTPELVASAIITLLGLGLFLLGRVAHWRWTQIPLWLRVDCAFEAALRGLSRAASVATRWLRFDRPLDYLPILLATLVLLVGGTLVRSYGLTLPDWIAKNSDPEAAQLSLRLFIASLMALAVLGVIVLKSWITQLISLSVSGFLMTFYYVLYRAPDLALTQILVDTVSLILILILLGRFPRSAEIGELQGARQPVRQFTLALLSIGVGLTVTVLVLLMTGQPHRDRIGQRFLDTTVELAGGSNAVNTVLVDYRGFDTLGEITVLFIAMLACLGLFMRRKRTPKQWRQGPLAPPDLRLEQEDAP